MPNLQDPSWMQGPGEPKGDAPHGGNVVNGPEGCYLIGMTYSFDDDGVVGEASGKILVLPANYEGGVKTEGPAEYFAYVDFNPNNMLEEYDVSIQDVIYDEVSIPKEQVLDVVTIKGSVDEQWFYKEILSEYPEEIYNFARKYM